MNDEELTRESLRVIANALTEVRGSPTRVLMSAELDRVRHAIKGLATSLGGLVFFAAEAGDVDITESYRALVDRCTDTDTRTKLVSVEPRLLSSPPAGRSPGEKEIAGLIHLLGSSAVEGATEFALAYAASGMDEEYADLAWSLVTSDVLEGVRCVIVVEGTPKPASRYLDTSRRPDYIVDGRRLARIPNPDDLHIHLRGLNLTDGSHPLVLLLGAGFSVSSGLPLANDIRQQALRLLLPEQATGPTLSERFYDWLNSRDAFIEQDKIAGAIPSKSEFLERLTLERVVHEAVRAERDVQALWRNLAQQEEQCTPGEAVRELGEVIRSGQLSGRLIVLTVNFDRLLERAVPEPEHLHTISTTDELESAPDIVKEYLSDPTAGRPVPYVKLHGTLDRPDELAGDLQSLLEGVPEPIEQLFEILRKSTEEPVNLVYIGHSLRDPDLQELLALASNAHEFREFWVSPRIPPAVWDFVVTHRTTKWGLEDETRRFILTTADAYLRELRLALAGPIQAV